MVAWADGLVIYGNGRKKHVSKISGCAFFGFFRMSNLVVQSVRLDYSQLLAVSFVLFFYFKIER